MRSLAAVIADLLPADTATAIRRITGDQELTTLDDDMLPVANPALSQIASALPADSAFQITHTAERLGFTDYSDVLAEAVNAVIRKAANPEGNSRNSAATLAEGSFPRPSPVGYVGTEAAPTRTARTNGHPKPARPINLSF
jgi:hypothetical protein